MGTLSTLLLLFLALFDAPLQLRATPKTGFAPMTIKVTTVVERHEDNRVLCVVLDGDDYARSSCESLEGANAPRTTERYFHHLPAGSYLLQAYVAQATGPAIFATPLTLSVIGP